MSKSTSLECCSSSKRNNEKVVKNKKNVFVATNLLESMIFNKSPTREINDVYNILELGASGLVLAAETAIGKNPTQCVGT